MGVVGRTKVVMVVEGLVTYCGYAPSKGLLRKGGGAGAAGLSEMHTMKSARLAVLVASGVLAAGGVAFLSGQASTTPAKPAAGSPTTAAAKAYQVDGVHSSVVFKVQHVGLNHVYGRFNTFTGTFSMDSSAPEKGSFEISVDAASIDTNQTLRNEHLRDEKYFNTAKHPAITFKSTEISRGTGDTYTLKGDITLRGVTKPITAELKFMGPKELPRLGVRAGAEATFVIKRSDFGMNEGVKEGMLGDEVELIVSLQGTGE